MQNFHAEIVRGQQIPEGSVLHLEASIFQQDGTDMQERDVWGVEFTLTAVFPGSGKSFRLSREIYDYDGMGGHPVTVTPGRYPVFSKEKATELAEEGFAIGRELVNHQHIAFLHQAYQAMADSLPKESEDDE